MIAVVVAAGALALAALPALLFLRNLRLYQPAPIVSTGRPPPAVSVLIPARNEERSIAAAVAAALASRDVNVEVLVLDDQSEDATARIVDELARQDHRVRLLTGIPLPAGWSGKQHACFRLAQAARFPLLAFLDADVRLAPDGLARMAAFLDASGAALVSGIPRQQTGTFLETLLIPLIHFVLLGYLPLDRMRRSRSPAYAAGCGQLFVARRADYEAVGGHGHRLVRTSFHDGITLPRAFRERGFATDLCDATDLATCRMYHSAGEVWRGLGKNASEGMAHPAVIGPFTLLLAGGQVAPPVLLALALGLPLSAGILAAAATLLAYLPRLVAVARFQQPLLGAMLHPLGVALLLTMQWQALLRRALGRSTTWKGRPALLGRQQIAEQVDEKSE